LLEFPGFQSDPFPGLPIPVLAHHSHRFPGAASCINSRAGAPSPQAGRFCCGC